MEPPRESEVDEEYGDEYYGEQDDGEEEKEAPKKSAGPNPTNSAAEKNKGEESLNSSNPMI